jgi:HD superfamily phosphodiesterase
MIPSIFPEYEYKGISQFHEYILYHISKYAEGFLRFVPRELRNFPSHGIDHSVNIIRLTNDFIEKWGIDLSENERFLLYAAAWLHDIGCIKGRSPHNLLSVEILLKDQDTCNYLNGIGNDLLFILTNIIESHSSSFDIDT